MSNEPEIGKEMSKEEKLAGISTTSQNTVRVEQIAKGSSGTVLGVPSSISGNSMEVLENTRNSNNGKNTEPSKDLSEKYRLIALNTSDLIVFTTFDVDPIFTFVSPSHLKILGFEADDLLGKSGLDFIHEDDKQHIMTILLAYIDAKINGVLTADMVENAPKLDFRFRDKSDQWHFLHSTVDMVNDELLFISKDITEQKRMEHELHEKFDKLQKSELATLNIMEDLQNTIGALTIAETKIREKNQELQKINSELTSVREELTFLNRDLEKKVKERTADVEKLLKQKDEFIGQLGHDLKTPLTPLNILLPIVKEREQDPQLKELLEVIFKNVYYMKNLVIKTLALAELNSPNTQLFLQDIDLSMQIRDILDLQRALFEGKNIVLENNIPAETIVQVDLLQIRELFDNLISNAVKYSQESEVKIMFDAKEMDDFIVISVKDTGIGLEPDQIKHVFDEFYKVDCSRHDLDSTGLGLSICKRIVEKHGGRIWVESQGKGKGSTFFFTLKPHKRTSGEENIMCKH